MMVYTKISQNKIPAQGRLRDTTPENQLPRSGSSSFPSNPRLLLDHRVRPFSKVLYIINLPTMASADFCPLTKGITLSRAMPLCCSLPSSLIRTGSIPGCPDPLVNQLPLWSLVHTKQTSHTGQISPNKNMDFQCTTAAFTLSPATGGLRHVVLTRPETKPSMRFLSVSSHLCAQASFRPPLARPPLPSASSYFRPYFGPYRYSYRGLSPHKSMPMSGVHLRVQADAGLRPRS